MNKCEHGQRITVFCASECCVWKDAAGCQACIKKYHNHMGTTVFLSEEQITALVKKYTMDSSIKPKCRVLQEAIYAYFNLVKGQLSSSLDAACKNIINQIGYPYLYTNNTLSTYKRLKNKEYKKLLQKDFRVLYDLSQRINDKDLAREEAKIYVCQMKQTEELINGLEDMVKKYETLIKKYHSAFIHDTQHISKINQIFKNMSDSPRNSNLKSREEKKVITLPVDVKEEPKKSDLLLKLEQVTTNKQPERAPAILHSPTANRPDYSRDVSLDKKIVKEHKFVGLQLTPTPMEKGKNSAEQLLDNRQPGWGKDRSFNKETASLSSAQKSERMESVRQELNNKEMEINERKKMLIEMMKQKEDPKLTKDKPQELLEPKESGGFNRPKPLQVKHLGAGKEINREQDIIFKDIDFSREPQVKSFSNNSGSGSNAQVEDEGKAESVLQNHAFTQLPVEEKVPKAIEEQQHFKEKVIVIPTGSFNERQPQQLHSPLLKIKNIMDKFKQVSKMGDPLIKPRLVEERNKPEKDVDNILQLIPIYHKKSDTQMQLKDNEEKSLALLLKSVHLKAEEAIVYLEKAIALADNNLSAVEYLSFLYLQLDRPADCLKLCNKMLQKIENSSQPDEMSLILNNNKAAALNILGRYSQSIVLLQRCLRYRQKDYFYKNLGDAYFSISIYEKAIYNFEKALRLNGHHDEAHYNLAVCLYIQENYHNARLAIQKAIQVNSLCEQYHQLLRNIETRINNY